MKRFIIILIAIITALPMMAQEKKGRFSREEFRAKLEGYITQKAALTQAETKTIFPLLHEMHEKMRNVQQQINKLKRCPPSQGAPQKEYEKAVTKISQLEIEAREIQHDYYKRLCKVVPASKVYAVILAEDSFHREMLQKMTPGKSVPGHHPKK